MTERPMAPRHEWIDSLGTRHLVDESGAWEWGHQDTHFQWLATHRSTGAALKELLRVVAERDEAREGEQVALRQRDEAATQRDALGKALLRLYSIGAVVENLNIHDLREVSKALREAGLLPEEGRTPEFSESGNQELLDSRIPGRTRSQ